MFNIDFESPRFKSRLRIIQYIFLTAFVIIGTIILVFAGQGYDINRQTGEVIQNGLMLVNTTPEGASVLINGQPESDTTPGRFPLPQGSYDIRIELDGYLPWRKQVSVAGSNVEWLYYPRLIPADLATANVSALRAVEFVGQSPDGQQLLVRQRAAEPTFNLFTLNDNVLSDDERLVLPASLFTLDGGQLGNFSFEGWSGNGRYALIAHQVGRRVEYIRLDSQTPANSLNLNEQYDLNLSDVRFIDGQANELYCLVNGDLRRLNLSANTISAPLVRDVGRYVMHEDRFVVYLRSDENDGLELGLLENGNTARALSQLEGKLSRYRLEFAAFDDEFHLGLLDTKAGSLAVLIDPHRTESDGNRFVMPVEGASFLSFSRSGQFVLAQGGGRFYVHDFDRTRRHNYSLGFKLPKSYEAKWLDGNYLLAHDRDGRLHIFEFDGGNEYPLVNSGTRFDTFVDSDYETLYTFTAGSRRDPIFLQSTSLIALPADS